MGNWEQKVPKFMLATRMALETFPARVWASRYLNLFAHPGVEKKGRSNMSSDQSGPLVTWLEDNEKLPSYMGVS